jgi:flagellar hook-associated protein 2
MAVGTTSLDVNSLVTQLVAQERSTYATRLTAREAKATVQLSAVSNLKGSLSSFKTNVDALKSAAMLAPRKASSNNEDVLTVTSQGNAATGSYDITVVALAKAQQLASKAFSEGSSAPIGTGKLTISYGTTSFDVDIDESESTLAGVRDAINKASGNTGVQATLLNEQDGTRLILTSAKTGAANTISISQSGGDGNLAQLAYSGTDTATMSQVRGALDAEIKIGTFVHKSATNTISGAIDDVTLTLKAVSAEPVAVSVTEDTESLKKRVSDFVAAYNSLYSSMSKLRSYDAATKAAGPLIGDALLRGIENQIGLDLSNPVEGVTGDFRMLSSLGISRQTDGTLKLDDAKLAKALDTDSKSVEKVFGGDKGVAARLSTHIEAMLKDGSALDTRTDSLQSDLTRVEKDTEALDARMVVVEARYRKQFTALDMLLTQLQTTSNYLSTQLASIGSNK